MNDDLQTAAAEYVSHAAFCDGLPRGRFRVVVNPLLARRCVAQRLHLNAVSVAVIGVGIVLAFGGHAWTGAALVFGAIVVKRLVQRRAGALLLQMALRDEALYYDATTRGVFEVQRRGD